MTEKAKNPWFMIALALVGLMLSGQVVATGYEMNLRLIFYDGLLAAVIILVLLNRIGSLPAGVVIGINTLILFSVSLPLVDLFYRAPGIYGQDALRKMSQAIKEKAYSYEVARGNPVLFRNWWRYYSKEWFQMRSEVQMPDPNGVLPFRLKPNSRADFINCLVRINSLGFRGREFKRDKGDHYRIVALGESTTMGATIQASDKPWPNVLEQMIRSRLKCSKPVEVINGGVWAYTLEDNLNRFKQDILPLKPDMIISYHGYNGFYFLDRALAPIRIGDLPLFEDRPSYLLAQAEYSLKLWNFRRKYTKNLVEPLDLDAFKEKVVHSEYAHLYEELMALCRTNKIKLVIANFNMAANENSPEDVVQFYSGGFPTVSTDIKANLLHNYMLTQIVHQNDSLRLIDTSRGLDGCPDMYIDLVHFTQEGRNQLAKNIFEGIKDMLPQEEKGGKS
ncbi:MAG: hypothetical protein M1608_17075 [Candidatus Omnitrophica bacterium]|nr:hypothetical protein [Candidatus Omnitrophota bacterium]